MRSFSLHILALLSPLLFRTRIRVVSEKYDKISTITFVYMPPNISRDIRDGKIELRYRTSMNLIIDTNVHGYIEIESKESLFFI